MHCAIIACTEELPELKANPTSISHPMQYWDDPVDVLHPGSGSLLPLWILDAPVVETMQVNASKHAQMQGHQMRTAHLLPSMYHFAVQVTALCWNPCYPDLLAVGYGEYDTPQVNFLKSGHTHLHASIHCEQSAHCGITWCRPTAGSCAASPSRIPSSHTHSPSTPVQ